MTHKPPTPKILIVDDEKEACLPLKDFLQEGGYEVRIAHNGVDALPLLDAFKPGIILMDMCMPGMNGLETLKRIKQRSPETQVIMVTAMGNIKLAEEALRLGAFGYITKPLDLAHLEKELHAITERRKAHIDRQAWDELADLMEKNQSAQLRQLLVQNDFYSAMKFSMDVVHYSNPDFGLHSKNVAWLSRELAHEMNFSHLLKVAELAGLYHDLGKHCLSAPLREQPAHAFNLTQKIVFNQFPILSQEILSLYPCMEILGLILKHQCEHYDGSGIPDGLRKNKIPVLSQIIAVSNAFEELLGEKNQRNIEIDIREWNIDKPLEAVQDKAGIHYNPEVVEALVKTVNKWKGLPKKELKLDLENLKPGMVLSREVVTETEEILFLRNTCLNHRRIAILKKINDVTGLSPTFIFDDE